MSMRFATARAIVACFVVSWALVACSAGDVPEPAAKTPSSSASTSTEASASADALAELAASASEHATELPTLLLIENQTAFTVLLTSADAKNTATIEPGKSLHLTSQRVCDWLPLTATTPDGRVVEEYTQPCRGQTWTITQ